MDCSSETELMLAKACGFSGEEIMFSANAMPYHEFSLARDMGAYVNLDDVTQHIDILEENGGIPENMKRGVLSQDGLYNLVTEWEAAQRTNE
ncbi:MAG: hypothetical protein E7337_08890 [Clostridiales bacterium]|nr:hypothetical protein [Clostridiales bacterium]MBE5811930.1 hypothetical protein [Clostridiales bacterium]